MRLQTRMQMLEGKLQMLSRNTLQHALNLHTVVVQQVFIFILFLTKIELLALMNI